VSLLTPALLILTLATPSGSEAPTLAEVVRKTAAAVTAWQEQLSDVVAEETYTQRVLDKEGRTRQERRLRSDFLLVRFPDEDDWVGFRDVFEVDGRPVRDRQRRLERLFLEGSPESHAKFMRLTRESARYNIGKVQRTGNFPTLALRFLNPSMLPRLSFAKAGEEARDGVPAWLLRFTEERSPTLIRRPDGGDVFAQGGFTVDPGSGRVFETSVTVEGAGEEPLRAGITVRYRLEPRLETWVPAEMSETYRPAGKRPGWTIEATATYSAFRRFGVETRETIRKTP
jgi:hypothetical protein